MGRAWSLWVMCAFCVCGLWFMYMAFWATFWWLLLGNSCYLLVYCACFGFVGVRLGGCVRSVCLVARLVVDYQVGEVR